MSRRTNQRGTALVEMALTISIFLLVVMGSIEFGFMMYKWARAYESTRDGVRTAIVTDPVIKKLDELLDCGDDKNTEWRYCNQGGTDCGQIMQAMKRLLPDLEESQVRVTYNCADIGFDGRPDSLVIPEVTVELEGYTHELIIPTLVGLPAVWEVPSMKATRTGEDMEFVDF